jgi:hypothetical protein
MVGFSGMSGNVDRLGATRENGVHTDGLALK